MKTLQALIVPYCLARVNRSRGKRHGDQQWQEDHWKATDAKKARKHNDHPSILSRWQNDEQYRTSQLAIGWTETYCRYLDYLTTIDISHHALESTTTMKSNDPNPQSGPMWKREDYRVTTKAVLSLREEQGRTNTYIPKIYEVQAEKHIGPRHSTKTGMAEPTLENAPLNTVFGLFFVMVAELVGRHSSARRSLGRSPMARSSLEISQMVTSE